MAQYQKSNSVSGEWVKGKDVKSGTKCKLVSEVLPVPSQFTNKDGTAKNQDVGKIRFQGEQGEAKNVSVNRATLNGLIEAFGTDSKEWIGKLLTAETLKMQVAGKMQTALYLIPEGFALQEDANGYMVIAKVGASESVIDVDDEEVDESKIPF